jgi:hypothetical protein
MMMTIGVIMPFSALILLCIILYVHGYTQAALSDQIVNLPGAEALSLNFNQFSGYLTG